MSVNATSEPLTVTHPDLAKEANGWDPSKISKGMKSKLSWKCSKGHVYLATVVHRTNRKNPSGCPICTNRVILSGFNDLASLFPTLVEEVHGWDPTVIGAGSRKILPWRCKEGHIWNSSVTQRTSGGYRSGGTGCPFCSGTKTLAGFNDLSTTHPEIAREANGWDPTEISAGSSKRLSWKCPLGHEWKSIVHSRTRSRSSDCPYCTNRKVLIGFNDLKSTHPDIAKEADGWDPTSVTRGVDKPRKWKCAQGHKWSTGVMVRTRGSGCPSCSKTGYDPNLSGYLYLIEHPIWNMYQIGITNDLETRMKAHGQLGWKPMQSRGPMDGLLAKEWETSILRMLRLKGADLANPSVVGKFDGYSEAWSKDSYEPTSISDLMSAVKDMEDER